MWYTIRNTYLLLPTKGHGRVASTRIPFDKLTAIHPNRRITLETGATPISMRLMDLFVPLGFGQRALIVAPRQAGKTTILRQVAAAVLKNYPEASLFLCLVDERPEEVTEWRMEVQGPGVKLYARSIQLHPRPLHLHTPLRHLLRPLIHQTQEQACLRIILQHCRCNLPQNGRLPCLPRRHNERPLPKAKRN